MPKRRKTPARSGRKRSVVQQAKRRASHAKSVAKAQAQVAAGINPRTGKKYTPAYAARLARAKAKGLTRQQARGHKPKEHVERAQKETARLGMTSAQLKSVISFYENRYNPKGHPPHGRVTLERMTAWAQRVGYEKFKEYRKLWQQRRDNYVRDVASGDYNYNGGYGFNRADEEALHDYFDMGDDADDFWHYH